MKRIQTARGFTLVELAVVLTIIGLLIAAATGAVRAQVDAAKNSSTKTRLDTAKQAITTFVSRNKRLPCPAVPTLNSSSLGYGMEAANPGVCTSVPIIAGTSVRGVLPWRSLGLTDADGKDAWGRLFTYQVIRTATGLTAINVSAMTGNINVYSKAPTVNCALPPAPAVTCNQINTGYPATFLVMSHGKNGFGAYTEGGVKMANPTSPNELENSNANNNFVIADFDDSAANTAFDDFLAYMHPGEILAQVSKDGSIKSAGAAMQERFDLLKAALIQGAVHNAATYTMPAGLPGGAHNYTNGEFAGCATVINPRLLPANLPGAPATTDIWGQQLTYTVATQVYSNPMPANLCPNGAALVSNGPDMTANTADDIVYTIPTNELFTTFSRLGF